MPAIAQSITVDSNTSVVLLNTQTLIDNQDIVVLLSTSTLPGRIISIRDTTGNITPLRRIVVSTSIGVQYFNTNYPSSVVINQPFGFITVTNRDPTTWVLQNTFAFPAEQSVADVQGVNANYMFTSTLFASNAITTYTSLFAKSTVSTTYVNTLDVLASGNLYVGASLSSATRFQATGSAAFTGNLAVWSTISTGQDIVVGRSLNVVSSFNVGGSTVMFGTLSTMGNVYFSSALTVNGQTNISSLSTFGLVGFGADVFMTNNRLNTSSVRTRELTTSNTTTTLNLVVNCNTFLSNISISGPTVNVGVDLYITNNSVFAASTLAKSVTASNILETPSTNTSSLTVYSITNLSSLSTTGIVSFANDVYMKNTTLYVGDVQASTTTVTNYLTTTSSVFSTLTVLSSATITNLSTFGSIGFGADVNIWGHTLRAQNAVVSTLRATDRIVAPNVSTTDLTASNTIIIQGTPIIFTPTSSANPVTFINISTVSSATLLASSVTATVAVASTFVGDGSFLTGLNAISTNSLASTIVGLGSFGYVSTAGAGINQDQLVSTTIGLGSLGYISSIGGAGGLLPIDIQRGVSTLVLSASNITLSNSFVATYATPSPQPAMFLNAPQAGNPVFTQMRSGATNELQYGVDGTDNGVIISQNPGVGYQPLNIYGSIIYMNGSNVQFTINGPNTSPFTLISPSSITTQFISASNLNSSNLNMSGVVTLGSNLLLTGGATAYLSNSGMLSNTQAAAFFQSTSNTTTLGVAGAATLASNLTMTAAGGYLSNAGKLSNADTATIASNVLLTGGTNAYLSNSGILSNTQAAAFFQTTSNTGTLGVGGITTIASNILQTASGAYMSNAGIFSNASNVLLTGGAASFLSNSGILSNIGAAAFFQNTSNTGTLGVAQVTTVASNVLLTGGTSAFFSNSGILSNTQAAAFFQTTSNIGTLGVGGITTIASNILQTAPASYLSNAGIFSNASNVFLTGGATAILSNSGIFSNIGAAAFFQSTSNTTTLGVAGITTIASNILQTAPGAYLSNAGIFSNASNVLLTGGATSFLSNSGILSNTGAAAFFQNTSNTGTLGVAQATTLASNLTMTAAGGFYPTLASSVTPPTCCSRAVHQPSSPTQVSYLT